MAKNMTQIKCPNCEAPVQATLEQLIDISQDPGIKSRLLSGSLNRVKCPVCGFEGQISSPLVYHDPANELLLSYIPVELNIPKDEQERLIGKLINQAIDSLPSEKRKGYLFQPQASLTMQSFIERILEVDGVTKEEIDAQRARMRLFEDLLRTPEEHIGPFIKDHDEEMDAVFFQLASITLQATDDARARQAVNLRIEQALELSSFGQDLRSRDIELKAATESLSKLGEDISREKILNLFIEAPNEKRVVALVNLIRPAIDYSFFQLLTERIDAAEGEEHDRLLALRQRILEVTEQIDKVQEARAQNAASLLKRLMDAEDLDQALTESIPLLDDFFFGILQANMQAAKEREDQAIYSRLETIHQRLQELLRQSVPPGVQFAQQVLEIEDEDQAKSFLESSPDLIDSDFLGALIATVEQLEKANDSSAAAQLRGLYRRALQISMRSKMQKV